MRGEASSNQVKGVLTNMNTSGKSPLIGTDASVLTSVNERVDSASRANF